MRKSTRNELVLLSHFGRFATISVADTSSSSGGIGLREWLGADASQELEPTLRL